MPGESNSTPRGTRNYLGLISEPLPDRIDLHIEVPPVKFQEISTERTGEASAQIRERVITARRRQQASHHFRRTANSVNFLGPLTAHDRVDCTGILHSNLARNENLLLNPNWPAN